MEREERSDGGDGELVQLVDGPLTSEQHPACQLQTHLWHRSR